MDTTTWANSVTKETTGFTSDQGKTTAGPRGQMTSPTNVARRLTAHEVGAIAIARTFINFGGSRTGTTGADWWKSRGGPALIG